MDGGEWWGGRQQRGSATPVGKVGELASTFSTHLTILMWQEHERCSADFSDGNNTSDIQWRFSEACVSKIWDSHGGGYELFYILTCNAQQQAEPADCGCCLLHAVSCFSHASTLKMERICSTETSAFNGLRGIIPQNKTLLRLHPTRTARLLTY
jgi:hypothetical protein